MQSTKYEEGYCLCNCQGNRFLGEDNLGKFTKVTDISKAKIFTNAVKANNVLTNCLNKTEQSKWFVKSIFEVGNNMKIKQIETINVNDNDIDLIIDNLTEAYQKFIDIKEDINHNEGHLFYFIHGKGVTKRTDAYKSGAKTSNNFLYK